MGIDHIRDALGAGARHLMRRIRPRLWKALEDRPNVGRSLLGRTRPAAAETLFGETAATLDASGPGAVIEHGAQRELEVESSCQDGRHTLTLIGALDLNSVGVLEAALSRLSSKKPAAVTLDLRGVTFIDSSGLWTITALQKWCARAGIGLMLIPGPESVHHVFELTGLSDVLPFARSHTVDGA